MNKVRVKKHLGQHFLNDEAIAKAITDLLSKDANKVVEVGPGMGVLTKFLILKNIDLKLVEIDKESILYLMLHYPQLEKQIIEADFLKLNLPEEIGEQFALIGNFPYNISTQILFIVFENKDLISEIIGMFQKEVAERILAKKGKQRGILSVLLQTYYDIEYCFTVNEDVFSPPPKVKSGVIKLSRNKVKQLPCDEKLFKQIVKVGFNQRRKTLRNALKSFSLERELAHTDLLRKRAEELSVEDFITITKVCQNKEK
ncbi:MAG: 16S rRNA (adenine(1518)-N(6)/adenine(1519)-N(6))-dimethyltransferase RsmA [Flavobacteriales bacterium]|jgi:16S rRNA (adenine1518-N6/adenine1519-N6)-dimethyltransferase|nr:16S rRNA (adenine(1518)-N(6)/adenine(1519)-N(6))-dimethyltransferase RsmA [Flavobacteriales bacterium]MDP7430893.1 16S rRNA (adenine(1518)-N(6)/adenine(1519)-N(6))-dimethyltransferase RsmA [Flavobacteriales bacterium]HJN64560.1 16S rRNA (adenine(1518)-N(6)/adenine(1519)-N(6))-dimethyltransferase RsmA [Flavobacteriales bacterium]|tara:strand:- start:2193 stop:2963 length:771 start_codon:yes stop_codon:yes gene_type:complete